METASDANREEKARVYHEYRQGEATADDVREVFGDDVEEFENFEEMMQVVRDSTTNEASDDLFQ